MAQLGRVIDTEAAANVGGPKGRLVVTVPPEWAEGDIAIAVPHRLRCEACDGGGCDACNRSGAIAVDAPEEARKVSLRLPAGLERGALVRLVTPFGESVDVAMLIVELRVGSAPSPHVRRVYAPIVEPGAAAKRRPVDPMTFLAVCLAICVGAVLWRFFAR